MQEEVKKIDQIAFKKDQVSYPDLVGSPIIGLPTFEDRLKYKAKTGQDIECRYICRDLRTMKSHCRAQYSQSNSQKRGRQKKGVQQDKMQEESQHCQRFFEFAQQKKYFQVSKQLEQSRQHRDSEPSNRRIERFAEEIAETMTEKRKERVIGNSSSRYLPNPQLEFVGWDKHLKRFKRSELLQMTESIEQENREDRTDKQKHKDRELA